MRFRPAGFDARSAVFKNGFDPLPQRADLSRSGIAEEVNWDFPLRIASKRIFDAWQRRIGGALCGPVRFGGQAQQAVHKKRNDGPGGNELSPYGTNGKSIEQRKKRRQWRAAWEQS